MSTPSERSLRRAGRPDRARRRPPLVAAGLALLLLAGCGEDAVSDGDAPASDGEPPQDTQPQEDEQEEPDAEDEEPAQTEGGGADY